LHVDQASKETATALSGWAVRLTEISFVGKEPLDDTRLEGSKAAFLDDVTLLLVTVTGTIHQVSLEREGRLVRQLVVSAPLGISTPPSSVLIHKAMVFISSTADHSVLLKDTGTTRSSARSGATNGASMDIGMLYACERSLY